MNSSQSSYGSPGRLLTLSAELNEAETVQTAVTRAIELVETAFDQPVVSVWTYDPATGAVTTLGSSVPSSSRVTPAPDELSESIVEQASKSGDDVSVEGTPKVTVGTDPREPIQTEGLVPVGAGRVLRVGVTEPEGLDETGISTIEGIAANLQTTLAKIDNRQSAAVGCDVARALFDQSNEASFVSNTDGALVAVNRAAVELTGRDRDALLTNGLPNIAGDTATEPVREHLERTVTGTPEPLTTTLEHAQDGRLTVELTSQPVDVDGTSYVHTIAHDPSSGSQLQRGPAETPVENDATALRQLNELTVGAEGFDETIERLLSIGRDNFDLDTGILSHVDGDDYEVDSVVDATGSHEAGAVYDLGDTMCDATLAGDVTETLAFADIADTDHQNHPAAENVRAYIAAPVVVNGDTYGTVNFSMGRPRSEAFRPEEKEFVKLVAQWTGTEIERRHRFQKLERYQTILEAVDDPVYALDDEGQFTFVNEAAEREFGYDKEIIGRHPSVGMDDSDVERMREQIKGLLAADARSTTTEFELETADGNRKTVENRLALIGEEEFLGTAGVLRDITGRKERRRQLESFQRAVEEAADGIAILDGEEYTYVDRTHVEMYGFEDKDQLLGNTWQKLYDDDEVERLEGEAFPALEADGYWRGRVTGSRPDGSTFPAELSLTIIGDGRLVCTVRDETERRERERELESFQRAVESARDGVAILDGDEYTYVDQSHVEMYGFNNKEQLLGYTWRKLYDDEEVERLKAEAFPALQADGYWRGMVTGSRPDGSTFPVELSLSIIEDGRLVCTVRDETEQQARKRELEGRSAAIEAAKDGVAILNEDAEYTYVNRSHADVYGYGGSEAFVGNSWEMCYEDPECDRLTSEALSSLSEDGGWRGEAVGLKKDGTTFPQDLSLARLDDGRIVCIVRDVTERKAREEELELKEHAMDEANVGIQITDPNQEDNPLVYVNDGFERMTGYAQEDALGRNPRFLQDEGTDPEKVAELREAIEREEPVSLELQNHRHDGTAYWSRLSITPVENEGGTVTNYIGIQQDVSQRREREIQREAQVAFLKRIYEVTADPELSLEEKITELLAAGRNYLDLPEGFLAHIERDGGGASGTQTIVEALGSNELIQPGESTPLEATYCRRTIDQGDLTTLTHAAEEGWADDPAYEIFELDTYIGSEVVAGDDLYTVCFASKEPRDHPFTEFERSFVRLLSRWVGYEIDRRNTREDLQEESERLELALSGTSTGLAEWNLETDTVTWNETLVDIVGREVDSFEEFRAAVHSDDRDRVQRELETMIETGDPWVGEFRILDADGDTLWLGTRATAVYDSVGEPVQVLATGTDISNKKQVERERRRNERRYRSLAKNIPNGAVLTFDEDLEYVLAAGELMPAFGVEESNISGETVGTVLANGKHELIPRFRAALDGDRTDRRIELRGRTLRVHIAPLDTDEENATVSRGLVLVQDVTEDANREQALFEERERFRLLTESLNEYAFLTVDGDGLIQTWNEGANDLFGYDTETAVGMSMGQLHPESDRESERPDRLLQQARIAGESAHEGWQVRADGSQFYADVRYAPLETDDGEFHGYATVVQDMTESRRQRRRTERFVEESEDVVTILDPDGTLIYASGSTERVFGYDPDALVGENLFDYLHPDGREHAMETFFSCVEESESVTTKCRLKAPDGEWFNIEGRCRNMLDDEAIDGILVYLRDVTESKERARRFESIFNQTFQFTGLLEPNGKVIEVNDAALNFGGFERSEIIGTLFHEVQWWTHSDAVYDKVRDAIERAASGEFVRYETEVRGGDGLATIDFSVKPVRDEDDEVSLLVVEGRDVSAQKRQRRHLKVMQRVMRHNIRNDLTKLRGWTQVMSEETDVEKRAEQLETVKQILDKWEAMAEKMQDIRTVLESQQWREARQEAEALVEDAVASAREEYAAETILTDVPDFRLQVPATLLEAVRELVENAAEASAKATIEVEVDRSADGWTEIYVRDDGPGMPEMEADVLETGEETPLNHGQGLGLWMVRMIVTQAGGDASVESTGDGTEVCLRTPARWTTSGERSAETRE